MRWKEFYEKSGEWAASTTVSRISRLESFGPPEEVIEVIVDIAFYDEQGASRLLRKATDALVQFSGEQLAELCLICDEKELNRAIRFSSDRFTDADIEALYGCCDDDILCEVARKEQLSLPEELEDFCNSEIVEEPHNETEIPDAVDPKELCGICDYILDCFFHAHEHMTLAYKLSAADMRSGKKSVSIAKYAILAEAEPYLDAAQSALEEIRQQTPGNIGLLNTCLSPGMFVMMNDICADGFFTNWFVQRRIRKMMRNLETAIREIQAFQKQIVK